MTPMAAIRDLLRAALERPRARRASTAVSLPIGQGLSSKAARSGVDCGQLGRQGLGDFAARQLAGRGQADLEQSLSGERSCSTSSGMPSDLRARIAPRVASRIRCLGTSALRTSS